MKNYRPHLVLWLASRFFANFAKQMVGVIVAWQVYQLTRSPLALGFVGLAEAFPYIAAALWAGHLADHHERRGLILLSVAGLLLCAVSLTAASYFGRPSLWFIYAMVALYGFFSSFETASSAYVQSLVPDSAYPRAIAVNLTLFQTATIAGPIVGGWLFERISVTAAYGAAAGLLCVAMALTASLAPIRPARHSGDDEAPWVRVKHGLKFIRKEKAILAAMTVDLFAVLWGDPVAILPVFADRFGVGAFGLGILRAAPAIGSAALSIAHAIRPMFRITWRNLTRAVTVFGLTIIAFAFSNNVALSVILLAVGGVADGMSVIIRSSIYQARTPDHLRGRVSSVNGIFIRSSNEIGAFESGLSATLLGTVPAVIFGGVMTLVSLLVVKWRFPGVEEELSAGRIKPVAALEPRDAVDEADEQAHGKG